VYKPRIVITSGEPAGIGPDACVMLAQSDWDADLVVAGDADLLMQSAASALGLPLQIQRYESASAVTSHRAGTLRVLHIPTAVPVVAGHLDARNAKLRAADAGPSLRRLHQRRIRGDGHRARAKEHAHGCRLRVSGPYGISRESHARGAAGHDAASGDLRVALVTTHLPLADVPRAITQERLLATVRIVHMDLGRHFNLSAPRSPCSASIRTPASRGIWAAKKST
jgi:4-hydroxythreonine-4-phosphate dehydrogenase